MPMTATEKLDLTNIGLMIISCCVAMVIPFELFLFVYAILGPLHYLTEISWLHDRNYYTKGKYDAVILFIIGALITLSFFSNKLDIDFPLGFDANLNYIALVGSLIFVTIKNPFYRVGAFIVLIFSSQISQHYLLFFTVFIPTLIHVYVFTALFMLYGALKSKSRFGLLSVGMLVLCPILLFTLFPTTSFYGPSMYSRGVYDLFKIVNISWLQKVNHVPDQPSMQHWDNLVFHSKEGMLAMRFIAFAYTYHYLNWFSKTKIIQWHNVPKARFAVVIIVWLISIAIYIRDYAIGLQWLVFLSFMHVLLEFPLNMTSIIGIGRSLKERVIKAPVKA